MSALDPSTQTSVMRRYALGTVAADLPMVSLDEDPYQTLEVFIDELFNSADGRIEASGQTVETSGTDSQGKAYTAKAARTTSVAAHWMHETGNLLAPCMRKGMRVELYRVADQQQLYWKAKGGDDHLLRGVKVIKTYNANPNGKGNPGKVNLDECYSGAVDTFEKTFSFSTSQANGEPTGLVIKGDMKAGTFSLADTVHGNLFHFDLVNHQLRYQNKEGSIIDVSKEVISIQCEDAFNLLTAKAINIQSKAVKVQAESIDILVSKGTTLQTQTLDITAQQTASLKAQEVDFTIASQFMVKCPNTTFTGSVNFTGEDGNLVMLNGNFHHQSGTWTAPSGTNVYTHDHDHVERGNSKTDPFQ